MIPPCINLLRSKEEAFYFRNSQINNKYIFGGIHLMPKNRISYVQVTNTPDGIALEDWIVNIKSIDDKISHDITDSFVVTGLTNSENGDPQIIWQLTNVPFDMGYGLCYLEVSQVLGETFYSSPFMMTSIYADKTSQFHYKQTRTEVYQSIGFKTWFLQPDEKIDLTTYYETSTQHTVTQAVKVNKIEIYQSELMDFNELSLLSMVLRSPYLYVDLVRNSLFEAISFPKKISHENFGAFTFQLSPKKSDTLPYSEVAILKKHNKKFNTKYN